MEFSISLAAALLAVLLYAAVLHWWRRSSSSSKPPPGPAGLPLFGSLPFLDPDLHTYFTRLAATHGPIFSIRLGTKLGIVVSSPGLAREVLKDHDPIFANRDVPSAARIIAYGGADIVWNPNGPTWRMLRRVCVREMLGPASLDAVYGLRRQEVRSTIHHLHSHAGAPVDVGAQMFLTVMNVITNMLWGGDGGGGGEELGGEGVPGAGGGDNGAAGQAQRVGFFPGSGPVRSAGGGEADEGAAGAVRPDLRADNRREEERGGGSDKGFLGVYAEDGEGRR